jgi:hypothetical protein
LGTVHSTGMTTRSQWAALRSPMFGAALLVLVLNDHWLKGAGLLPGWLTGKLSDFAGLIVAPILAATLARARARYSRLSCWALVAASFAAIKLWPAAARSVEHFTRWAGLGWRIWSDPIDLIALSVLPLGWWIFHSRGAGLQRTDGRPTRVDTKSETHYRWWLERTAAVVAMLACVATSSDSRVFATSVALVNTTHEPVELQVFRPSRALDCDAVVADPKSSLIADDFAFESCTTLEPLQPLPLDLDWSVPEGLEPRLPPPGSERACDAVLLRAPGLDDTVLFWNDVPKVSIDQYGGMPDDPAHIVLLEQVGDRLFAGGPDVGQIWPATFSVPQATCEVAP